MKHLACRYLSSKEITSEEILGSMTTSFGEGVERFFVLASVYDLRTRTTVRT